MIASVLISAVSVILLVYWFRYSCLLLLTANPADKRAAAVARANRLGFLDVQHTLVTVPEGGALDDLYRALDSDHRILAYLLENSTGLDLPGVERHMLMLDYRVMRLGYRILRGSSPDFARKALLEMSQVLACFSQKMGERTAQHAATA